MVATPEAMRAQLRDELGHCVRDLRRALRRLKDDVNDSMAILASGNDIDSRIPQEEARQIVMASESIKRLRFFAVKAGIMSDRDVTSLIAKIDAALAEKWVE